jgi:hypothetical protein
MSCIILCTFEIVIKKQLYAQFMLVLFGTFLVHAISPHVHHSHTNETSVAETPHHHHHDGIAHNHADQENTSDNNETEGLLAFILGHHTHATCNFDYTTEVVRVIQKKDDTKKGVHATAIYAQQESILVDKKKKSPSLFGVFIPENPFLLNCSLRAPPSIA